MLFRLDLPLRSTPKLVDGGLYLRSTEKNAGVKLLATSGLPACQYTGSWLLKGKGCIPPSSEITPFSYTVTTQRLWLPQVKGVEGDFYAISPFQVGLKGTARGDFGIHRDANMPGSAGCIVMRSLEHWQIFIDWIKRHRSEGHQVIPLTVIYS